MTVLQLGAPEDGRADLLQLETATPKPAPLAAAAAMSRRAPVRTGVR